MGKIGTVREKVGEPQGENSDKKSGQDIRFLTALEASSEPVLAFDLRIRASSRNGFRFGRGFFQLYGDHS